MAYRCISRIILVTAGALIVGACAAPVTPPIQADKTETPKVAALSAAEPTVFGRLELSQDGKQERITAIGTFDVYGIAALAALSPPATGDTVGIPIR